jgi:hypothetical protein
MLSTTRAPVTVRVTPRLLTVCPTSPTSGSSDAGLLVAAADEEAAEDSRPRPSPTFRRPAAPSPATGTPRCRWGRRGARRCRRRSPSRRRVHPPAPSTGEGGGPVPGPPGGPRVQWQVRRARESAYGALGHRSLPRGGAGVQSEILSAGAVTTRSRSLREQPAAASAGRTGASSRLAPAGASEAAAGRLLVPSKRRRHTRSGTAATIIRATVGPGSPAPPRAATSAGR